MSGCAVCVYDLYEESLEAYHDSVASLRASLSLLKVPESEWPPNIQSKRTRPTDSQPRKETILSAFEEMERALAMKKEKQAKEASS